KVDKKKLPKVEYHSKKEFKDASSPEEKIIKSVFEEVLNIKKISVNEDYFDIGGDSIKSVRIVNKLKEHGIEIDIKQLLADRTIEKIAMNISCLTDETFEK
ncbi:TPA: phosphopantetheine-binding protein, partial [Streptococcus agalactiae]